MSQPSELPESVRDPLAALLAGFKKEAKPYVWSYGVGGHSKEVLWYVLPSSGYAPYVAPGNPPSSTPNSPYTTPAGGTTAPAEWTALPHEIAHFWGLDHTNLHPGSGTAAINSVTGGSLSVYPPTAPVPGGPLEIPVTVGGITWLGAGYNLLVQQLPPDDATALSRIYPVLIPDRNRGKYPLINMSATIQGQYRASAQGVGIFGKNILAVPALTAGTNSPTFAQRGVISGTARLDMDPLLTATAGLYVDTRPGMNNAPYYAGPSVTGLQSGTGDFSLQGLIVGGGFDATTGTPLAYDVIMESSGLLGVSMGNQAEWFNEGVGVNAFYAGTYAQWVIPMNVIVGATPPSQPVNVIFLSKVQTNQAFDLVNPTVAVIAAWGRNDVVF